MNVICPSCKTKVIFIGSIPQRDDFAGDKLEMRPQADLYNCRECNLYFKYPRPSREQLDGLYKNANPQHWQYNLTDREDWQIAIRFINKNLSKGTIVDVGCWDGAFLINMEASWKCYGTEINPVALNSAKDKGVEIISDNFDELMFSPFKFDVVTAFNVIEHTEDPLNFIRIMSKIANDNGLIIISTGNSESYTWKLSKGKYWYSAFPEHLSFINVSWAYSVADRLNLQIEHVDRFSHVGKNTRQFIFETIRNVAYLVNPALFVRLKKIKHSALHNKDIDNIDCSPPSWKTSKDHFIVIFRKK